MDSDVHTETAPPELHRARPREDVQLPGAAHRHGIVQQRTTVDGKPVALVLQRSTYGHELDSALGFGSSTTPASSTTRRASRRPRATSTTRSTGSTPTTRTSPTTPPACCRSGRGRSSPTCRAGPAGSTTGRAGCPFNEHARETNPKRGYLVSWNNKPAPGFSAADDTGATARSTARWRSRSGRCRRPGQEGSTCPAWSA